MILPPEIRPHETKSQIQDESVAAKKKAETGFIPVSAFLFLCSSKQTVLPSS